MCPLIVIYMIFFYKLEFYSYFVIVVLTEYISFDQETENLSALAVFNDL